MNQELIPLISALENNLSSLVKVYRGLLNLVRREREILVSASIDDLAVSNQAKEKMLVGAREIEKQRIEIAKKLASALEIDNESPRLLDIARKIGGNDGERLERLHTVLTLLMNRVKEFNAHNEALVNSALGTITGAMSNLRENLGPGKKYKKSGKVEADPAAAGQLVRREA